MRVLLVILPLGCVQSTTIVKGAGDTGTDAPTAPTTLPDLGTGSCAAPSTVDLEWRPLALVVDVAPACAGGFLFGMVESGSPPYQWTDEACTGGDVCHTLGPSGGTLDIVYDPREVEDGATLFSETQVGILTYKIEITDDGRCWAWGDDPGYYVDRGCERL